MNIKVLAVWLNIGVLILVGLLVFPANATEQILKVSYQVVCADPRLEKQFSTAIKRRILATGLNMTDRLPKAKLLIYINQDINDSINPDGYSIAVAHLTNYATYFLASKLIEGKSAEAEAVRPAIMSMLREEGFMTHINVAHIDKMNEKNIALVANALVDEFAAKTRKSWE